MSEHAEMVSLRDLVAPDQVSHEVFADITRRVFSSVAEFNELRTLLYQWDAEGLDDRFRTKGACHVMRGFLSYLNGEVERAEELLAQAKDHPWGAYWMIRVLLNLQRWDDALNLAEKARQKHPDFEALSWLLAEVWIETGWTKEAEKLLDALCGEGSALHSRLMGDLLESCGQYEEACAWYDKAIAQDPADTEALFRRGYLAYLYGDDDEAIASYEACVRQAPVHVNALINLGVIYEDHERYEDAQRCFNAVLRFYPTHSRARLYLADIHASLNMYYDKNREKELTRQSEVLLTPIGNFELPARCRNCLERVGVETLGDLIMKTEEELLSYQNFGDNSLDAIRGILAPLGLRLGQGLGEPVADEEEEEGSPTTGVDPEKARLPIDVLNLSIRSRRCMERLKVFTVGDLIQKREVDLLAAKNFGDTSLKEVKEKLGELGLQLRE